MELAVSGGTNILSLDVLEDVKVVEIETEFGSATLEIGKIGKIGKAGEISRTGVEGGIKEGTEAEIALLRRHGINNNIPPHRINHAANFAALKKLGVKRVIGMGSVGCLKSEIELPAIAIPHDYIDFFSSATTINDRLEHVTPGFDEELRKVLIEVAREVCGERGYNLVERAVYFQSRGPRLETKAEVRVISSWADCVGMTAGSEATVAKELGIGYACVCTMDNYANGVRGEEVDYREIVRRARMSAEVSLEIVSRAIERLL